MLGRAHPDTTVVADFDAGLGGLVFLDPDVGVDLVLVVAEPYAKSLDTAARAVRLARAKGHGTVVVVANRCDGPDDEARVRAAFPGTEVVVVPDDPAIAAADRAGVAALDSDPDAPGVRALLALGAGLAKTQDRADPADPAAPAAPAAPGPAGSSCW
ncbi:MAG: hypothetical protein LC792_16810 [Actinobacteria bacterium]|nr:hypothetical protein [Actinomycetota bacterium]